MADTPTPPDTPDTGGAAGVGEVGVDPKWELPFSPNGLPGEFLYGQPVNEYGGEGFYDHSRPGGDATHPFKVDRYIDPADNKLKLRVRKGYLYSQYSIIKPHQYDGHDHGHSIDIWPDTGGPSGFSSVFPLGGDGGIPLQSGPFTPKVFKDAAAAGSNPNYAYLDNPTDGDGDNTNCYVYLRWVLNWVDGQVQPTPDEMVEVVAIDPSAAAFSGAIGAGAIGALVERIDADEDHPQLMRPNAAASTHAYYSWVGDAALRAKCGIYWRLLATVTAPGSGSGIIVDQVTHEHVEHTASWVEHTYVGALYGEPA